MLFLHHFGPFTNHVLSNDLIMMSYRVKFDVSFMQITMTQNIYMYHNAYLVY